jgi:hypothetical protein
MRTSARISLAVGTAVLAVGVVAGPAAAQDYYWKWSDGSQKAVRTFDQSTYHSQKSLPHLVITAVPATPAQNVLLQFKENGKWSLENRVRTGADGVATVDINPYCSNDTWCDGTWKYRLKIGTQYQLLTLSFHQKP